jgi:hypothetical protein
VASAGTMTVTGQWSAFGDGTAIALNSVNDTADATPAPGNGVWTPFTISGPVTVGINALEFSVLRDSSAGTSAPGVRVEIFSVTPEPSGIAMLGALAVALIRRR